MGYIDDNLIEGETVIYEARLHWVLFLKPMILTFIFVAIAAALFYFAAESINPESTTLMRRIGGVLIVLAIIPVVVGAFRRSSREYAVTNKRVVMQIGVVGRMTEEVFLNKIESIGVDQTVMGRMLGYGTVTIRGTGGSFEPFERVSAPLELRRQIQDQIGKSFGGTLPTV
jgi:uncharacterized membrane protein YdbT with pleckstrin-like domain